MKRKNATFVASSNRFADIATIVVPFPPPSGNDLSSREIGRLLQITHRILKHRGLGQTMKALIELVLRLDDLWNRPPDAQTMQLLSLRSDIRTLIDHHYKFRADHW
jgi:hypothetical protein